VDRDARGSRRMDGYKQPGRMSCAANGHQSFEKAAGAEASRHAGVARIPSVHCDEGVWAGCWPNPGGGVPMRKCWRRTTTKGTAWIRSFTVTGQRLQKQRGVPGKSWASCCCCTRYAVGLVGKSLQRRRKPKTGRADADGPKRSSRMVQRLRFGGCPALRCAGVRHDGSLGAHRTTGSRCRLR